MRQPYFQCQSQGVCNDMTENDQQTVVKDLSGMFDTPAITRFYRNALTTPVYDLKMALCNVQSYYAASRAKEARIITQRLWCVMSISLKDDSHSAVYHYLDSINRIHVRFVAALWCELRSPRVGLTDTLITAIQHIRTRGKNKEHRFDIEAEVKTLASAVDALDALLKRPYTELDKMEEEAIAEVKTWIQEMPHSSDSTYYKTSPDERYCPAACRGDALNQDAWDEFVEKSMYHKIDAELAFASDHWLPDKEKHCMEWPTGDNVLRSIIDKHRK